jgi:hypothetical protein
MHVSTYLGLVLGTEQTLADALRQVGEGHAAEADVFHMTSTLAQMSDRHVAQLTPIVKRYGEAEEDEPERLHATVLPAARSGAVGLLRDLQDLQLLATLVQSTWTVLYQAAQALRDHDLMEVAQSCNAETSRQLTWLTTHLKTAAPQALLVAT